MLLLPSGFKGGVPWLGFMPAYTPPSDVVGYRLYRRVPEDGEIVWTLIYDGLLLTFVDTDIEIGKTYEYALSAYDAAGNESAKSAILTVIPCPTRYLERDDGPAAQGATRDCGPIAQAATRDCGPAPMGMTRTC